MLLRFLAHILILNLSCERSLFIHGIQLKILALLVFLVVFWIPWRGYGMTPNGFPSPHNNTSPRK
ncbi:MAG: hypothetical protein ACEY3D_08655 [Rickettsia sp.]|uniref:hypothetical protein n=1 Tax=Rickettsia sp. TaxID=789 RepID=UPI00397BE306